jgi:hypothetical protein
MQVLPEEHIRRDLFLIDIAIDGAVNPLILKESTKLPDNFKSVLFLCVEQNYSRISSLEIMYLRLSVERFQFVLQYPFSNSFS